MNEEHMLEYNEDQFPQEEFDKATLKMLDAICEGVEVPSDEDCDESICTQHGSLALAALNSTEEGR
jgi:hypothetical protein